MWRAVERWGSQIKSGLSLNFLSRLFGRPKTYEHFESTEDIFSDAKEELESDEEDDVILMRDGDPYEVTYEHRKTKVKGYGATSDYDIQIHTDSSGDQPARHTHSEVISHCNSDVHTECTITQTSSARLTSSHHRRQGSSVREEVGDLVTSVFQRQYNKLENDVSDDDHSSRELEKNSICDSAKEGDSKSKVFHSIKDISPNWKAKKPKRRKKVRVFQFLRRITNFTSRDHAYARTK